jgi:hypothetical protein
MKRFILAGLTVATLAAAAPAGAIALAPDASTPVTTEANLNPRFKEARDANLNKLNSRFESARERNLNKLNQRFKEARDANLNKLNPRFKEARDANLNN